VPGPLALKDGLWQLVELLSCVYNAGILVGVFNWPAGWVWLVDADELEPDDDIVLGVFVEELIILFGLSKCSKKLIIKLEFVIGD